MRKQSREREKKEPKPRPTHRRAKMTADEKLSVHRGQRTEAEILEGKELIPIAHRGRSLPFSHELSDQICDLVASGETLRRACQIVDICERTVRVWILDDRGADMLTDPPVPGFATLFERARLLQSEAWADHVIEIADESSEDTLQVDKLRVDTRLKMMGKNNPTRFGDRSTVALEGGAKPLTVVRADMTPEEAAAAYAASLA